MPLYKYLEKKYLKEFLEKGHILFRAISYFQKVEQDGTRGDYNDGALVYQPEEGLKINEGAINVSHEHYFRSTTKVDHIYVFCLSKILSRDLAKDFKADCCVEVVDVTAFIRRVKKQIKNKFGKKTSNQAIFAEVNYYQKSDMPGAFWPQPKLIVFRKLKQFSKQEEFRLSFPTNGAFDFENLDIQITSMTYHPPIYIESTNQESIYLGNIDSIAKIHYF